MDDVIEAAEHASGEWQELQSGVRQHHWATVTMEQGRAKDLFEMMNLGADRGLG
jgi:hypothetical protein